jgi:hypothetical protein
MFNLNMKWSVKKFGKILIHNIWYRCDAFNDYVDDFNG